MPTFFFCYPAVRADVEIGSESGSGAINCPGTLDVNSDGVFCDGKPVSQASDTATTTDTSSAQSGFVAATIVGALVAAFM